LEYFEKIIQIEQPVDNIYSIIANINNYPDFLPFCDSSTILSTTEDVITAKIDFNFYSHKVSITTENKNIKNESIEMRLMDGPFNSFNALWLFSKNSSHSTNIKYSMEYQASNPITAILIKKNMNLFIDLFIEAFKKQIKKKEVS
jgi:ribosome-associated toxin RatA of RatAB toxin-antitoxin module